MPIAPDVIVQDHGTLFTFCPRSQAARDWWAENVQDAPCLGRNICVEHRFAPDIIEGLKQAGFVLND
jgi:hypothetical protein